MVINTPADFRKGRQIATYNLTKEGLAEFYKTLTDDSYVLLEATLTSFSFVRLFQDKVKQVIVANTYQLKSISVARHNTDKIDSDILCVLLKMQIISGVLTVSPVTIPSEEIQTLRTLYTTYRLEKKQITQTKNRIHSILKERLYGFTQEEIFDRKSREAIRKLEEGSSMSFQLNMLLDDLGRMEEDCARLKERILIEAEPYMHEIDILTSMKGISVFIAVAVIADIINVNRFKDSKAFTSYLRSAPHVAASNTSVSIRGTQKKGRKLSGALVSQSLNHVLAGSEKLNHWYERLTKYKKAGLVRMGLRRRVFAEMFQMLKKGEYHYARDKERHNRKMGAYKKLLEKRKRETVESLAVEAAAA
jgi:transposase